MTLQTSAATLYFVSRISCACKASRKIEPLPKSCARSLAFLFFDSAEAVHALENAVLHVATGIGGMAYGSFITVM